MGHIINFYNNMQDDILNLIKPIPLKYISKSTICMKCNVEDKALKELKTFDDDDSADSDDEIIPNEIVEPDEPTEQINKKLATKKVKKPIDVIVKRAVKNLVAEKTLTAAQTND